MLIPKIGEQYIMDIAVVYMNFCETEVLLEAAIEMTE